jgi:hypothetical protein
MAFQIVAGFTDGVEEVVVMEFGCDFTWIRRLVSLKGRIKLCPPDSRQDPLSRKFKSSPLPAARPVFEPLSRAPSTDTHILDGPEIYL